MRRSAATEVADSPAGALGLILVPALILLAPFGEGSALPAWQALLQTLLLVALGAALLRAEDRPSLRGAGLAAIGLLLSAVLSSLVAPNLYGAWLRTLDIATFTGALFLGGLVCAEGRGRRTLALALAATAALQSFLAMFQAAGFVEAEQVAGTMLNPNHLAALLGAALLLAWGSALPVFVLAVLAIGFLVPASRGAIAGLAAGAAVASACIWSTLARPARARLLAAGCAGLVVAALALAWRFESDDRYRWDRPSLWAASLETWGGAPSPEAADRSGALLRVLGIGPGQFEREAPGFSPAHDDQPVRFGKRLDQTHSDLLQLLVEQGLAGLVAGLVFLIVLVRALLRRLRESAGAKERRIQSGMAGALAALGVQALVENLSHRPALLLVGGLIAGSAAVFDRPASPDASGVAPGHAPPRRRVATALAVLTACAALWVFACGIAGPFLADRSWQAALATVPQAGGDSAARASLDRAISLNRFQPAYHARLANLIAGSPSSPMMPDQFARAMDELDEAERLDPRNAVWPRDRAVLWRRGFGDLFHDRSSLDAAAAAYVRAEALDPRDPFTPLQRGTLLASVGDTDGASVAFARAREIEPNLFAAWLLGARLERERGLNDEADRLEAEGHRRHDALARYVPESDNAYEHAVLDWPEQVPRP